MKKTIMLTKITLAFIIVIAIISSSFCNVNFGKLGGGDFLAEKEVITADAAEPVTVTTYRELTDALSGSATSIILGGDITSTDCIKIPSLTDLTLDLNGFTIDRGRNSPGQDGSVIFVPSNSKFTLTDTSVAKTGKITGGYNYGAGGGVYNEGEFTMKGGEIIGNKSSKKELTEGNSMNGGGVYCAFASTFTMEGGKITGNTAEKFVDDTDTTPENGGGVYNDGTFTMTGGEISGNTSENGGGVYNNRTFTMTGGTISDNTSENGGGVYNDGTFNMTDGTISGNKSNNSGGGIYNNSNRTFTMTGGTISGNKSENSGGGIYNDGIIDLSGGTITNNIANETGKMLNVYGGGVCNERTFKLSGTAIISGNSQNRFIGNATISLSDNVVLNSYSTITLVGNHGTVIDGNYDDSQGVVYISNTTGYSVTGDVGAYTANFKHDAYKVKKGDDNIYKVVDDGELPNITAMTAMTYNGGAQVPTVTLSGATLTTDYTLAWTYSVDGTNFVALNTSNNNFKNAGTYKVTATGVGKYNKSTQKTATYVIKKAKVTLTAKSGTMEYGGTPQDDYGYDVSSGAVYNDEIKNIKATTTATSTTDVGNVAITLNCDANSNYEITKVDGTLTISQATNSWTKQLASFEIAEGETVKGKAIPKVGEVVYTYYADNEGIKGAVLSTAPTKLGTYFISAKVIGTKNFTELVETEAVKFEIVVKPISSGSGITISSEQIFWSGIETKIKLTDTNPVFVNSKYETIPMKILLALKNADKSLELTTTEGKITITSEMVKKVNLGTQTSFTYEELVKLFGEKEVDPTPTPTPTPTITPDPTDNTGDDNPPKNTSYTWLWVALGVVAIFAVFVIVYFVRKKNK